MSTTSASSVLLAGVQAQLSWHQTLSYLAKLQTSSSISAKQCFLMNGTLFLGSIVLFTYVLTPLLEQSAGYLAWLDNTALASQGDNFKKQSETQEEHWKMLQSHVVEATALLFQALWLVPMYVLSIVLNATFNLDIAKQVYTMHIGPPAKNIDSLTDVIRDSLYNYLLMGWVSLFCLAVDHVPIIGPPVSLIWTSWAIAFYAYDIVWTLEGWDFQKRLLVFQRSWLFMLGFGFPPALMTFCLPQFLGYGIYALAFPMSIMLAITFRPILHTASGVFPKSFRMFAFAEYINLLALRCIGLSR
mmetsp:Transcript_10328/g.19009  ORF Transcript_10328/g.19009 Transcript_10328/m.19009 type:complete len:301 (-) Transcript_10328:738-1640(-)